MTNYFNDKYETYNDKPRTKSLIEFMSQTKNANIATFLSAVIGGVITSLVSFVMLI